MKANTMTGLFVLMAAALLVYSKPTSVGDTDVIAKILQAIEGREEMGRVASYLKASRDDLVQEFPLFGPDGTKQSYTFFAPTSFAFTLQTPQDTVDPLFVDDDLRRRVLIRHFVRKSISSEDLAKLSKLVMADSKEAVLTFQSQNEVCNLPPTDSGTTQCEAFIPMWTFNSAAGKCENYVYGGCFKTENLFETEAACQSLCGPIANTRTQLINDAIIQPEAVHLPQDIGVVYIVERVFMNGDEVNDAITSHFQRNPNTALCLGLPCSAAESRSETDGEVALDIRHTPLAPPPETPAVPGGYNAVSSDEPEVQQMAQFATEALSHSANRASPLLLVKLIKAERQAVAGFNYRLQLQLKENPETDVVVCDVVVFDQPWSATRQITSSSCDPGLTIAPKIELELTALP